MGKVLVAYHYFANYRYPILKKMSSSDVNEYYYAYGSVVNDDTMNTIDPESFTSNVVRLRNIWFGRHFLFQFGLIRAIRDGGYDSVVLLGNMFFISTWVAAFYCRLKNIKVFYWTHGVRKSDLNMLARIRLLFYKLADGLFLYGDRAKNILVGFGYPADKIHVIYNSLDYQYIKEIKEKRRGLCTQEDFDVTFVGRLTYAKRVDLLLKACAKSCVCGKGFRVNVIGDGPELDALKDIVAREGISKFVSFSGKIYDEAKIANFMLNSKVVVVPGDVGLSAIHALSYGVPVVTHGDFDTQKPEFEVIKDGVNGSFYKYGDVDDLVAKIEKWIVEFDPSLRDIYSEAVDKFYNPDYQLAVIDANV